MLTWRERDEQARREREQREAAAVSKVQALATELEAAFLGQFVPMNFRPAHDLGRFELWLQSWLQERFPYEEHPRFTARTDAENPSKIYFPNLSLWLLELACRDVGFDADRGFHASGFGVACAGGAR